MLTIREHIVQTAVPRVGKSTSALRPGKSCIFTEIEFIHVAAAYKYCVGMSVKRIVSQIHYVIDDVKLIVLVFGRIVQATKIQPMSRP